VDTKRFAGGEGTALSLQIVKNALSHRGKKKKETFAAINSELKEKRDGK